MRRIPVASLVAALLGLTTTASADLIWNEPSWTVTVTGRVSGEFPDYRGASASSGDPAADDLSLRLAAFAEKPPPPPFGLSSASVRVEVSRSFSVVGDPEPVTLRVAIAGALAAGPFDGAVGADLTVEFDIAGSNNISIDRAYSAPGVSAIRISEVATGVEVLGAQDYIVHGVVELSTFAFSGGPLASGDIGVVVALSPTPRSVPEPAAIRLLGCGIAGWLAAAGLRRWAPMPASAPRRIRPAARGASAGV